jgi:tRNA(adenine34) deaminase
MKKALVQAKHALELGEVPIGCVIVCDGKVVGRGYNRRNTRKTTLAHAEITAIDQASRRLGDWRLEGCTMYVTLEPCPMCAGAIQNCGIKKLFFGTYDEEKGACLSKWNVTDSRTLVYGGILKDDCEKALREFFDSLRGKTRGACDE